MRGTTNEPAPSPSARRLDSRIRWAFGLFGLPALLGALAAFVHPPLFIGVWPWTLTPLTARVMASWFALVGTLWILIARDGCWSAVKIVLQSSMVGRAPCWWGSWLSSS